MTDSQRAARAVLLLRDALDLDAAERGAFLDRECAGDVELRAELEALLGRVDTLNHVLDQQALALAGRMIEGEADTRVGQHIGGFRIDALLGEGGMGSVYRATRTDSDFVQTVALKIIRGSLPTPALRERFRRERAILASLNHPGIARMLDGGVDEGALWFAMEYVDGLPLDRYIEQTNPDLPARLGLLMDLCDAVQHAHQHLVVHRDLKPGNILIQADGRPKLLDFGIAKHLDDGESLTVSRAPMSLAYAAPEQIRGEGVTTLTDVYALGVLLFELLTGERPHKPRGDGSLSLVQAITDTDAALPSSVVERATARIRPGELKGDLDTIVLKALSRDPTRRYVSAQALADDLARVLANEPIDARRDAWSYRLSKLVRRNRLATASVGIALLAMLTGAGVALHQRNVALAAAQRADGTKNFILKIFTGADAWNTTEDISAFELTLRGLDEVERELPDQPEARAELYATIASALSKRLPIRNALRAGRLLSVELNALPSATSAQRIAAEIDIADYLSGAEDIPEWERQLARIDAVYADQLSPLHRHRLLYSRMYLANVRGNYADMRAQLATSMRLDRSQLAAAGLNLSRLDCRERVVDLEARWQERDERTAVRISKSLAEVMDRDLAANDLNRGAFLWHVVGTLLRVAPDASVLALRARVQAWTAAQFGGDDEYFSRLEFHELVRLRQAGEHAAATAIFEHWMRQWAKWPEEFVIERRHLLYQGGLLALAEGDHGLARERLAEALSLAKYAAAGHPEPHYQRAIEAALAYLAMQSDSTQWSALEHIERTQAAADDGEWWQSAAWLAAAELNDGDLAVARDRLLAITAWHEARGARYEQSLWPLYQQAGLPAPTQPSYANEATVALANRLMADAERTRRQRLQIRTD